MKAATRSCACLALVRAFCPGEGSTLRECRERDWSSLTFSGTRLSIEYDLPSEVCRKRAFELVELADGPAGADIPVRGWTFVDVEARVRADFLTIEALAVRD